MSYEQLPMATMKVQAVELAEINARFAVFSIFLDEPLVKLTVMGVTLIAAIAGRAIAAVELAAPTVAIVRTRAVRREAAEYGHGARRKIEDDAARLVDDCERQVMVVTVPRRQITLYVIAGKHFGRAVGSVSRIDGNNHRDERIGKFLPADVILVQGIAGRAGRL